MAMSCWRTQPVRCSKRDSTEEPPSVLCAEMPLYPHLVRPPCPECRSTRTVQTDERTQKETLYCPTCGYIWDRHLPPSDPSASAPVPSHVTTQRPRGSAVRLDQMPSHVLDARRPSGARSPCHDVTAEARRANRGALKLKPAGVRGARSRALATGFIGDTLSIARIETARPIRVLVVDAESSFRGFAWRVLREAGYAVEASVDGLEALSIAQNTGPFDLFVMDVFVAEPQGYELAMELLRRQPDAKVLNVMGNADTLRQENKALGEKATHIVKPASDAQLRDAISILLFEHTDKPTQKRDLQRRPGTRTPRDKFGMCAGPLFPRAIIH
jgi:CheY-like chemotaxis protein